MSLLAGLHDTETDQGNLMEKFRNKCVCATEKMEEWIGKKLDVSGDDLEWFLRIFDLNVNQSVQGLENQ